MSNPITLPEIIADLKARDFLPHAPTADNNGLIEVFSKYNFSFLQKSRTFYVVDNDGMPVFLFMANDGNPANSGLFYAKDVSNTPSGENYVFTNTKLTVPGLTDTIHSIDNVSTTKLVLKCATGFWSVTTNGDYTNAANWTCEKLVTILNTLSQLKTENGHVLTWDGGNNDLVVSDTVGTVKSATPAYRTHWVDLSPFTTPAGVTSDGPAYGVGHIVPMGNNKYALYQTRLIYSATDLRVVTLFSIFTVNANGTITWQVNPETAGWRIDSDTPYSNVYGQLTYGFFWHPDNNLLYLTNSSQWPGYIPVKITITPNFTINGAVLKTVKIPDASVISKSAAPGWYFEIGAVGSDVYALRAGIDSTGDHFGLSRYTLVGGVPTIVNNGLPDGSTIKEALNPFIRPANTFFSVKKGNLPYLYTVDFAARIVQSVTFNAATSNVKLTTVKSYNAYTLPNGEITLSILYDQWSDRLFIFAITVINNGGHKLYQLSNAGVLTLIGGFGTGIVVNQPPVISWSQSHFLDLDRADPMFWLSGAYPINGGYAGSSVLLTLSGAMTTGMFSYIYNQNASWSKLLNKYTVCCSPGDQSSTINGFTIDVANVMTQTDVIDFKLPAAVGLSGFISNGKVHLGGFSGDIYEQLANNGYDHTFMLPANSTCYLYLIRTDPEKLRTKITTLNEPNTFYKVKIATFITNAVSVTSSVANLVSSN